MHLKNGQKYKEKRDDEREPERGVCNEWEYIIRNWYIKCVIAYIAYISYIAYSIFNLYNTVNGEV